MIFILNTEIPNKKKVYIALQHIFGVGKCKSKEICDYFGVSNKTSIQDLTILLKNQIIIFIEKKIIINEDLKQHLIKLKEQQQRLKTYKGQRAKFKLPRRGQRTHTNAKTAKKFYS